MDAAVERVADDDEVAHARTPQQAVQVRADEGVVRRLVDHGLALAGPRGLDDLAARLAADEETPEGARGTHGHARALELAPRVGRQIREVRPVALARVEAADRLGAARAEHRLDLGQRLAERRDVVA